VISYYTVVVIESRFENLNHKDTVSAFIHKIVLSASDAYFHESIHS